MDRVERAQVRWVDPGSVGKDRLIDLEHDNPRQDGFGSRGHLVDVRSATRGSAQSPLDVETHRSTYLNRRKSASHTEGALAKPRAQRRRFRFFEHELDDGRRIEIEHARSKQTTLGSLLLKELAKCWLQIQVQWRWEVRKAASCRPHYTATQQKPAHWRQHLREWGEDRHGLAALGDFQDLALLDAAQVHAQVLSQLAHRNLSPPGHVAHCSTSASLAPMPRRRWTQPLSLSFALPGAYYVRPCRCRPHGRDRHLHDRRYDALVATAAGGRSGHLGHLEGTGLH